MRDAFDEYTANPPSDFDHFSAPTEGFRGVFEQLVSEHRQVARLIGQLIEERGKRRADSWQALRANLLVHEYAEQHAVYTALGSYPSLKVLLEQHAEGVREIETLILQLDVIDVDNEEWKRWLHRLDILTNEHVKEEEVSLFPRAQDVLGTERTSDLTQVYIAAKSALAHSLSTGMPREVSTGRSSRTTPSNSNTLHRR